jgi:hypothetical protein
VAEIGISVFTDTKEKNMNKFSLAIMIVFLMQSAALSQSQEPPKFEVAVEFTSLERSGFNSRTDPGVGGRFTYNFNKVFSLDAAGYFFPKRCFNCRNNGRITEALGGVKVGKRFERWGSFGKARPGVVSFSEGEFTVRAVQDPLFPFEFESHRLTSFATDVGAVLEFYPLKRIVTRFDAGDTLIHFKGRTTNAVGFDSSTSTFILVPITTPARTTHNFQFMASVGFRF